MRWGSWKRGRSDSGPGTPGGTAERPSVQTVLGAVAEELTALHGQEWRVDGEQVRGPGRLAVRLGGSADDHPDQVELVFLADTDRPGTAVPDRVAGIGAGSEEAVRRAVEVWAATSGVTMLELVAHNGRFAGHLDPLDQDGLPGWHAIHGGMVGWGTGERHHAVQDWLVRHPVLPALAPALAGPLGRDQLVGVTVFFGGRPGEETAEVLVDGRVHEAASKALAALDWPRPADGEAYARTFVLLVKRA
ncbi:DUF6348 family protein [Kitasatospora sp. NPDC049285]|uniref:DUF6348 family protein n=1 Tax=Kitasatospora sp. NPDC049285 TaxID=3157096 RepID=UPI003444C45D